MKGFAVIVILLGVLVLVGGVGYSGFLIQEQSTQKYVCSAADSYHKKAEKAAEAYKAAKGTPQEKELERDLRQQLENEQLYIQSCSEEQSFYKTRITVGFLLAAGGFLVSLVGAGIFLLGRKRSAP